MKNKVTDKQANDSEEKISLIEGLEMQMKEARQRAVSLLQDAMDARKEEIEEAFFTKKYPRGSFVLPTNRQGTLRDRTNEDGDTEQVLPSKEEKVLKTLHSKEIHLRLDTQQPPMDTRKRLSAHVLGQWYCTYGWDRLAEQAFKNWAVKTLVTPDGKPHTRKLIQDKIDRKDDLTTTHKPNKGRDKNIAWLNENVPCPKKSN